MSEGLTQRVKRIIAGGAHALVDALEGAAPTLVLEESLREVDQALEDVRAELGRAIATRHLATRRLAKENERHLALGEQLELALAQGRDDLAEAVISQQLDLEAQLPLLEQTLTDAAATEKELERCLVALQARRRQMAAELEDVRRARATAEASTGGARSRPAEAADAQLPLAPPAARQKEPSEGGTAQGAERASRLAELEDLARKNRVQERLAQAKAKHG